MIFNYKKFFLGIKSIIMILLILILNIAIPPTYSKYTSIMEANQIGEIANYVILNSSEYDVTIDLHQLKPGDEINYPISIKNFDENNTSEVGFDYTISIKTQKYLPLTFVLKENGSNINLFDINNTYTAFLPATVDTAHDYVLTVNWDSSENDYRYSKVTDYEIYKIVATQVEPE